MSFEWQTEDEHSWEQRDSADEQLGKGPRRRWPWVLLLVVLIGTGVYYAWQQVQEQVDEATEAVRNEVRASYSLANRAASERDEEIFVTLLSGRSATWTEGQKERLARGLLFGETARLFEIEPVGETQATPQVQLNPELSEAVLTVAQPFVVDAGAGLTETVVLTQTHVLRQGSQRWLLSPPTEEFWGGAWRTRSSDVLQLTFRPRDEELARRLGDDLERKLMEMCRTVMPCPEGFHMSLRLESDVNSVLYAADGEGRLEAGQELLLPTPTLVGLPGDEAAYAALFRGYASNLLSAAMVEALDYSCCEAVRYQEALLDWQLSRLNLRSAPITAQDYLYLVDAPQSVDHLVALARPAAPLGPGEESPLEIHAFIDFLRTRLAMRRDPITELQRSLTQNGSFWGWVGFSTEYEVSNPSVLSDQWSAFIWDKARQAQELARSLPEESSPQQDLVAICGSNNEMNLYRYSLLDGQWTPEIEGDFDFAVVAALPGGDGYMMTGQLLDRSDELQLVTYIRRGPEPPFRLSQEPPPAVGILPWERSEPGGNRMVIWLYSVLSGDAAIPGNALVDPATCSPDGCEMQRLPGMPIWSPSGRLALAYDIVDGSLLYLPPEHTQWQEVEANLASQPSWLDDNTFMYVEVEGNVMRHTVWAVRVTDGESHALFTSDDLRATFDDAQRPPGPFRITWAGSHPYRQNTILALATSGDTSESYLFAVSPDSGQSFLSTAEPQITLLQTFLGGANESWFGVDYHEIERYLVIPIVRDGSMGTIIYDLQAQEPVLESAVSASDGFLNGIGKWSLDGNWYARSVVHAIDVLNPSLQIDRRPYRQLIFHDFGYCMAPTWVNRE